jgi:hypothetical protein
MLLTVEEESKARKPQHQQECQHGLLDQGRPGITGQASRSTVSEGPGKKKI